MNTQRVFACAVACISLWATVAPCQPMEFDWYAHASAGYGICAEDVSGDGKRDVITSHYLSGSHCWFNNGESNPATFYAAIPLPASGWDAKFGQLRSGAPKDLAVSVGGNITTYLNQNNTLTFQHSAYKAPFQGAL